jgi:RNase P subunit RPR2
MRSLAEINAGPSLAERQVEEARRQQAADTHRASMEVSCTVCATVLTLWWQQLLRRPDPSVRIACTICGQTGSMDSGDPEGCLGGTLVFAAILDDTVLSHSPSRLSAH